MRKTLILALLLALLPAGAWAEELSEVWSLGSSEVTAISAVDLNRDNILESVVYGVPGEIPPRVSLVSGWSYDTYANAIVAVDLDSDGYLDDVVVASQNKIVAIDSEGELKWSLGITGAASSGVAVDLNGNGYRNEVVVAGWQKVYGIDSGGRVLWNYSKDCKFDSAVSAGNVIIVACGTSIYALSRNGELVWSRGMPEGDPVDSIAAIDLDKDGVLNEVVAGSTKGGVAAFSSSGVSMWDRGTTEPGEGERVEVYAIDSDGDGKVSDAVVKSGNVYLYDAKGNRLWLGTTYTALPSGVAPADFDGDKILDDIIVGKSNALYGYDARGRIVFNTTRYGATILRAVDVDSDGVVETVGWGKARMYALKISPADITTSKVKEGGDVTAPGMVDSDGDGVPDEREAVLGLNPAYDDTDADGLTDGEELYTYKTNPKERDTDGDGVNDGEEVRGGTDPLEGGEAPQTTSPPETTSSPEATETPAPTEMPAPSVDSDGDGLSDEKELELGTNQFNPDSDGDGIIDSLDANPLDEGGLLKSLSKRRWVLIPFVLIVMLFGAYFVKGKIDEIMWRKRGGW